MSATKNKLGRKCWHRTWARLQLKHVVDQRAFWHVFRLLLGSAGCILLARVSFCNDAFSAVFTFFLCVSAFGGSTWLSVKEVLIGSCLGMFWGALFAVITTSIDPVYWLSWHSAWLVLFSCFSDSFSFPFHLRAGPLAVMLCYYFTMTVGLEGKVFLATKCADRNSFSPSPFRT